MEAERGDVLDRAFIAEHTQGFEDFAADIAQTRWDDIERESGLSGGAQKGGRGVCEIECHHHYLRDGHYPAQ
jgi:anaerobic selenocysteine-containing dehydrogenase